MELCQHQELVLHLVELQCLHFYKHFLDGFKREVLQHVGNPFEMLFDSLFL